jgi:hypothetical protein
MSKEVSQFYTETFIKGNSGDPNVFEFISELFWRFLLHRNLSDTGFIAFVGYYWSCND